MEWYFTYGPRVNFRMCAEWTWVTMNFQNPKKKIILTRSKYDNCVYYHKKNIEQKNIIYLSIEIKKEKMLRVFFLVLPIDG